MPIYEYRCNQCGNVFDAIRSMSAADQSIACEKCASKETSRLLSKCYTHSQGGAIAGQKSTCGGCSGGSCASCAH